jgi:hypothetical protein
MEFAPPKGPLDERIKLGAAFEPAEFTAPAAAIPPLPGLEDTSAGAAAGAAGEPGLPPLEVGDGLTLPPLGEPAMHVERTAPTEASAPSASAARGVEELELSAHAARPIDEAAAMAGLPMLEPMGAMPELPAELPPPVIAAEAALLERAGIAEADEALASRGEAERTQSSAPAAQAPFVTETMADLYLKQGFRDQALDVYRMLLAVDPENERLRARIAELQPARAEAAGPTVRDFFARLAARRPGERGDRTAAAALPADDDFASLEPLPAPMPAPEPVYTPPHGDAVIPAEPVEGAVHATAEGGGSIDALFGSRPVGTSEDSAAAALAQAFGAASDAPVITGHPARAAAGELSLDSVFRDTPVRPPRNSQGFSFDEFFSESATADRDSSAGSSAPPEAPPLPAAAEEREERSADDIEQFNSWLQGLKHR